MPGKLDIGPRLKEIYSDEAGLFEIAQAALQIGISQPGALPGLLHGFHSDTNALTDLSLPQDLKQGPGNDVRSNVHVSFS